MYKLFYASVILIYFTIDYLSSWDYLTLITHDSLLSCVTQLSKFEGLVIMCYNIL